MYEIEIKRKLKEITGLNEVKLSVPPAKMKADLSTNVAMVAGLEPGLICRELEKFECISETSISGPGFINIILSFSALKNELIELNSGPLFHSNEKAKNIIFEMVSSNPTGPLHIGHGRGAAIGDSLARIYNFLGHNVIREYYVNDAGRQMQLLGESVYNALNGLPIPEDGYKGDYIKSVAKDISKSDTIENCTVKAGEKILNDHFRVLEKFSVKYDNVVSEKNIIASGRVKDVLEYLKNKGLTYEKEGALWFKSSDFEDDSDRVMIKHGGDLTYFASDCAYHLDKADRSDSIINFWGADHHGYMPRIRSFWEAADFKGAKDIDIVLYQLVNLKRSGEKIAMSTRAGEFVTLEEVIDEVGKDAVRFFMLMRSSDAPLDFDLEIAKQQSRNNPVYYVQYSYARISSIFRKTDFKYDDLPAVKDDDLGTPELKIIKILAHFVYLVEKCRELNSPHFITEYLRELSGEFHSYYDGVKVIGSEQETTRLSLLKAIKNVISCGLNMIGVDAPEEM